jgi:ketosteroid isomerase-like protein
MSRRSFLAAGTSLGLIACTGPARVRPPAGDADIAAVETAFAQTMADRDFAAFGRFIDDEAVFLNGGRVLRGRAAILDFWKKQYAAPDAPFSWAPDLVAVLPSGDLATTEGPVKDPAGTVFARFYSTWRRNPAGEWKIVFDNGHPACGAD